MYQLKKAAITDVELIQTMAQEVFPYTYKNMLTEKQIKYMMEMMYSNEVLQKKIKTQSESYYIASKENTPCGYLSFERLESDYFYIQKIYILPKYQGAQCGSFLFKSAMEIFRNECNSTFKVGLNMNKDNVNALKFYQKQGMNIIGSRKHPIGNGYYMDDYILEIEYDE
mgnify:FL=1